MTGTTTLERLLRRDRAVVVAGLVGVILLSWAYLLLGAGMPMDPMSMGEAMAGMAPMAWSPSYALLMVVMWAVMMAAMMLPSAAPMILLFAAIDRKRRQGGSPYGRTWAFALGYVVVWLGFSLVAAALQWQLERVALLSPMMASTSAVFGGVVLLAVGFYQLTPLKQACLKHCRSPLDFILHHWRAGMGGATAMGLAHGAYCLGCCWMLMALLFVGGVMNLLWIAAIAAFVLVEKTAPAGHWLGHAAGLVLIVWGGATIASALP
ncbi:DUF2182 domain-containing protein [Rhodospirillaceae bacterium SYSU D60014]|uniref:DUF2182 domain-containing protein n=1 Tax=Virgifigura deserti TaxID=2268457 RepID=UPI000E660916